MCDPEQTSYRKCRTSQSKEQSGFQGLGRWSVVSETGLVDGVWDRALEPERVLLCCLLCSACARALSRLQSQVAVAVAGEEGRGLRLEARPGSFCPTSRARAFFLLPRSEWLGCRYRQPTAHIHTHTTITGTQTHTDRSEQDL